MHRLLERQVSRTKIVAEGPVADLLTLIDASYTEADQERKRQERANSLLSEELKELNLAIRTEAEARVRAILEAVSDGVVIVDEDGKIDGFNAAASGIFGIPPATALGMAFADLWEPGFAAPGASGEGFVRREEGAPTPVEATMSEALLASRRYRIALVRDVTERKNVERVLRETTERAQAASRAKSEFLATMSHELRTPMNGVLGMVGLLLDAELPPNQRGFAEAIRESGEALLALLNDLLDFSKIEAGKLTLEKYDFTPAAVIESVVELLAPRALAKNIEIAVVIQPGLPRQALGDAGRLRQVLMNLVGNAVKFTEKGGVVVELRATSSNEAGFRLRVDVVDSGIGIGAEALPRLFAEFVQADASTTRRFGGTGLGLAICKRICELMGGQIGVESTEGKGSRFWFELPLEAPAGEVDHTFDLTGLRCLVVDDNPLNCEIFERQLKPWGAEIITTSSGDGALAELVKGSALGRRFDVAIIDQHMPGMSGSELGAIVRAMPALAETRMLLATSGLAEEAGAHFDVVFTKPVRPSALLAALGRIRAPYCSIIPREAPAAPPTPSVEARRLRILVVEDNTINQKVAVGYLEKAGHRVEVASNGVEAVAAVRGLPYDVVLMDVQMPEMDGLTATRTIRAFGGDRAAVPIIGLTANAMKEDRDACIDAGMNDYLPKPVERAKLLERVARWAAPERVRDNSAPPPVARSTPAEPPLLDRTILRELAAALGDEGMTALVTNFVGSLRAIESELDTYPKAELRDRVHGLCGSAGAMGAFPLSSTASEVERLIVTGGSVALMKKRLRDLLRSTIQELSSSLANAA